MAVRGALMLNDDIDIALSLAGMQRVENIGIAGAQVVLNKAPGFGAECLSRTVAAARAADEYQKIACGFAVAQKALKQTVVRGQ